MLSIGALVLGAFAAQPANAESKGGRIGSTIPKSDERIMVAQAPLSAAANQIRDLVEQPGYPGFAGITIDVAARTVSLYWKGEIPATVRALVDTLRMSVDLRTFAAPHSRAELDAQVAQIVADEQARGVPAAYRAHTLSILPDGSGIQVRAEKPDGAVQARRSAHLTVRTRFEPAGTPPAVATRMNDTTPYWGGGRLVFSNGGSCTSGFGVTRNSDGVQFLLTAGHCGAVGNTVKNGSNVALGTVWGDNDDRDSLMIRANSGTQVFDGAWNDSTGYHKPVVGRAANNMGEYVCTSGSFSGVRCNIKIVDDSLTTTINGHTVPYIVEGYRMDGTAAMGEGDSGGPVFALSSDPAKVIARGTISGGKYGDEVACVGVGGRTCYKTVRYMPISVSLNNWAMTLNLGS